MKIDLKEYEKINLIDDLSDEFYEKFDEPKEKIKLIIETLPLRDKILLYKRFSKNYDDTVNTYEKAFINETIIVKIRRNSKKLGKTREIIYIRDIIDVDEETLIIASKKCELYKYLSEKFSYDLKGPMLISSKLKDQAISKEKKQIIMREVEKINNIQKVKLIKPFHEKFIKFKREDETYEDFVKRINKIVFAHLNPTLLNEIKLTYNENLLGVLDIGRYKKGEEHNKNIIKAYNIVKDYLKKQNQQANNPKRYEPIENILKETIKLKELLEELSRINPRTIELMKLKYGEDYTNPNVIMTLTREENKYLTDAISVARKRIKEKHK
ncbi:MAG: hypothetical protein HFE04_03580 [Bacilli bacterium]|nr:hypothetical protein [Bacilli bacterium]